MTRTMMLVLMICACQTAAFAAEGTRTMGRAETFVVAKKATVGGGVRSGARTPLPNKPKTIVPGRQQQQGDPIPGQPPAGTPPVVGPGIR
jgi:hypothetical protein